MSSWHAPDAGEPLDPNPGGVGPGYAYPAPSGYPASSGYPAPSGYAGPYSYPAPGYAPYGYPPAPGYPPYGYPTSPRDVRPGMATAAAVLAFVTSALLILAGLVLFVGGAIANDVEDSVHGGSHIGLELALDGVVNLVAGGLLIAGGATLVGRNATGRILLSVGSGIVVAAAIYWIVRFADISSDSWVFDAGVFTVLAVLSVAFAWATPVTQWLRDRPARRTT